MKKANLNSKLILNKATVSNLNKVKGGDIDIPTFNDNCFGPTGTGTFGNNCHFCGIRHESWNNTYLHCFIF